MADNKVGIGEGRLHAGIGLHDSDQEIGLRQAAVMRATTRLQSTRPGVDLFARELAIPRTMAIRPVRTSSMMPKGRISSMNASIFRSWPEISIDHFLGATSTMRPRKISTSSLISLREPAVATSP